MTKPILYLAFLACCLCACQNELDQPVDYVLLQQKLDNDPDVLNFRKNFKDYTQLLASFQPGELEPMRKKLESCDGFYSSKLSIHDMEKCLENHPNAEKYITTKKYQAEALRYNKIVMDRYPELKDLERTASAQMLLGTFTTTDAQEMLSIQQKARNLKR